MRFRGKIAIVTGAARGIGYEIAQVLAKEDSTVIIGDISSEGAQRAAEAMHAQGFNVDAFTVDVGNVSEIRRFVQGIWEKHHRIDILVNNAGICPETPIEEISESEWDRVLSINLKSVFFFCQCVIPIMREQRYGKIVNISSIAGEMGALVAGCHYSASKAGILGLTKVLARYLAPWGINVNAVAPGTVDSPMTAGWAVDQKEMLRSRIPLGRLGNPRDIATAVAFLASDESCFITGATLDVNGGALMR